MDAEKGPGTGERILLFGGTTEGRALTEALLAEGYVCTVCVATGYGAQCLAPHPGLSVREGRMDSEAMAALMRGEAFACVIDATHPYATEASKEIQKACSRTGTVCLRCSRKTAENEPGLPSPRAREQDPDSCRSSDMQESPESFCFSGMQEDSEPLYWSDLQESPGPVFFSNMQEAAAFLAGKEGKILATTGSKELGLLVSALGGPDRVVARILPAGESLQACSRAGLKGSRIIAMQGPFDVEMNCAMIRHFGVSWLLTKESGRAGGYSEKLRAAKICGITPVVIRNPEQLPADTGQSIGQSAGQSIEEILEKVRKLAGPVRISAAVSAAPEVTAAAPETGPIPPSVSEGPIPPSGSEDRSLPAGPETGPELALVGIGVGTRDVRTPEAADVLARAEVIFGAPSVLQLLQEDPAREYDAVFVPEYDSRKILDWLARNPGIRRAAVAYSGDSGFYSGAASMLALIKKMKGTGRTPEDPPGLSKEAGGLPLPLPRQYSLPAERCLLSEETGAPPLPLPGHYSPPAEHRLLSKEAGDFPVPLPSIRLVCGISCISWFSARTGIPWQDMRILSSHGRRCNVAGEVRRHRKCFLLLSGAADLRRTGGLLAEAQRRGMLGALRLICGYSMSRPEEEIRECTAAQLCEVQKEGLYVLYIEHPDAEKTPVVHGLPDSAFTRGKVPMTSAEVRALSLSRLRLTPQAILYDVGAGTGSVSVEAALVCPEGTVYSVEKNDRAVELLEKNRDSFCLSNMLIVRGQAPEALQDLPAPTHAFIGGSGGQLEAVLRLLLQKNPAVRIVVNCITLETLAQLQRLLDTLPVCDVEWTQISAACGDTLGSYHFLRARNPVFVISFSGAAAAPRGDRQPRPGLPG